MLGVPSRDPALPLRALVRDRYYIRTTLPRLCPIGVAFAVGNEACLVVDRPFCELGSAITATNFFAPYAREGGAKFTALDYW